MGLRGKWVCAALIGVLSLSFARSGMAQVTDLVLAESAKPSGGAPDVVRLKNGSLLRGTISELIAGETVTIVTITGKTRELPMADVEYAGPAERDPAAAPAAPAPATAHNEPEANASHEAGSKTQPYVVREGKEARLHLTSTPPGLTFHRQTGSAMAVGAGGVAYATGYERLCSAPCDLKLPAGTEVLALSEGDEAPRKAAPITFPAGNSRLVGSFESRAGTRAIGWTIFGASLIAGGLMLYGSFSSEQVCTESSFGFDPYCHDELQVSLPLMLGGVITTSVGVPLGIVLGVRRDVAKVELAERRGGSQLPVAGLTLHATM